MVGDIEHDILAVMCRARIAGGDEQLVAQGTRREAPGEGVVPPAGTDEKNVHGLEPSLMVLGLIAADGYFAYPEKVLGGCHDKAPFHPRLCCADALGRQGGEELGSPHVRRKSSLQCPRMVGIRS